MSACRTCIGLDCDDGPALGTYSLQRVILPEVTSTSGEISVAALGSSYGCLDSPFSANIVATGRLANSQTKWSVIGGSLPTGLTLVGHGNYATLSGTPTAGGIYRFTVLAEASNGDVSARQITFPVYRNWVVGACTAPAAGTLQTIAVGFEVFGIAYCPSNEHLYITNPSGGTVVPVDTKTGVIGAAITVGTGPSGICYADTNDRIYVANQSSDTISVINPNTNTVVATVACPNGPQFCAFGNEKVYFTRSNDATIAVVSTASVPAITSSIATVGIMRPIAYSSQNNSFYTAGPDGNIYRYNATTDALHSSFPSSLNPSSELGICTRDEVTPDKRLFVANGNFNDSASLSAFTALDVLNGSTDDPDYTYLMCVWRSTNDRVYVTAYDWPAGGLTFVHVVAPNTGLIESIIDLSPAYSGYSSNSIIHVPNIDQIVVGTDAGLVFIT